MSKTKNDTEGKGSLPENKDKALLNGEGVTSHEPPSKGDEPENSVSAEENKNPEGAISNGSTDVNAQNQTGEEKGASAGELTSKQDEKVPSDDKKKDEADAPISERAGTQASPNLRKAADRAKDVVEMMNSNKVDVLFENSKGEYFTSENLAHLSEKGAKDKVKTHRKETLELLIKSVE